MSSRHTQMIFDFIFPHAFTTDNKYVNIYITSVLPPKSHLNLMNYIKMETCQTMSTYWVNKLNAPFPSVLPTCSLRRISWQKKHLVSACLLLCSLCIYSLLSLMFFLLSPPHSTLRLSLTQAVWWRCSRKRTIWVTIWNQLWRCCSHPETQWRMGILYL